MCGLHCYYWTGGTSEENANWSTDEWIKIELLIRYSLSNSANSILALEQPDPVLRLPTRSSEAVWILASASRLADSRSEGVAVGLLDASGGEDDSGLRWRSRRHVSGLLATRLQSRREESLSQRRGLSIACVEERTVLKRERHWTMDSWIRDVDKDGWIFLWIVRSWHNVCFWKDGQCFLIAPGIRTLNLLRLCPFEII